MDIRNKKGMLPVEVADGEEHTPAVLKRYPEAAAVLRTLMRAQGLAVPDSAQPGVAAGTVPSNTVPGNTVPGGLPPAAQAAPAPARSIRDGVYSEGQATRGELNYRSSCGRCHSDDLMGDRDAPALVGGAFTSRWGGQTVDDLFQSVKRTMPQEAPDTLGPAAYADIVSYIIKSNGHPAGASDLPIEALKQIGIPK
jgi:mono/diheme cytochrome c family protein